MLVADHARHYRCGKTAGQYAIAMQPGKIKNDIWQAFCRLTEHMAIA